jgi:hypothetical protein
MTVKDLQSPKRILLGHLNSNGDCLFATAIARQIKSDYPGCHLTWAIGSMCRSILEGNPHVDDIWEVPLVNVCHEYDTWRQFEREALARFESGEFDEIFLTQIAPGNFHLWDGTIRSSIFRGYHKPITVPISPVLRLAATEVENVRRFAEIHHLSERAPVILFECSPKSGQSFITPELAIDVARIIVKRFPEASVVLSSNIPIQSGDDRIVDGSPLSLRENAELANYCSLLVGGSSGISWISTSDWAKPLPMIQLLNSDSAIFASFVHDYEYWGLSTEAVIEMTNCSAALVAQCVEVVLTEGFASARMQFHQDLKPRFDFYNYVMATLMGEGEYRKATSVLGANIQRHGLRWPLIQWYFYNLIRSITPTSFRNAARMIKGSIRKV